MNKQDLLENYSNDELADMVIKKQQELEDAQKEINSRQNQLDRAKYDYESLISRSTEKAYTYIKRGSISLVDIVTRDDKLERYKVENEVQKLNTIIDILLENLKGKSE